MGCCCSKPVDETRARPPSKGETQQETQRGEIQGETQRGEIQGGTPSKPVDEPLAANGETRKETQPKGETQGGAASTREAVILLPTFTSIISEASDILKPMETVSEFIQKILEVTKVSFNLPDETSLFTKSQRACRR